MKRASEVLRSKMCVAQRLPTERVDNLQHLHVLVKAGSRVRENRYQIYRVLLLLLSLHNSEILRCIVVVGDQAQPAIYTHDGDSCTGCKLSTVEACSRSTCATTSSLERSDLERSEAGEYILGHTRDPSKTSARWLLGMEEPSRESSGTCPLSDSAHTHLAKSKGSHTSHSIVRYA